MSRRCTLVVAVAILLGAAQVALTQVEWTWQGLVVSPGPIWDTGGHMLGEIVFDGARHHMDLIGGPGTDPLDYPWSVGHWSSTDIAGPWLEDPANPVLSPFSGCNRADSIAVILEGDTAHGWVSHCNDIWYATAPMGIFADDFEDGSTAAWSVVVP